jgi:hypothetical protein
MEYQERTSGGGQVRYLQAISHPPDAERVLTFAERASSEFRKGSTVKKRSILAALGTEHTLVNRVLAIKTQKPLRVVHAMVSESKETGFPLEPPKEPYKHGSNGKKKPVSLRLWTIPESNRSPLPCHGSALPNELMAQACEQYQILYGFK